MTLAKKSSPTKTPKKENEFRFQVAAGHVAYISLEGKGWKIKLTGACPGFHADFVVLETALVLGVSEEIPECKVKGCLLVCPLHVVESDAKPK